jgi:hypothetical protein
LIARTREAIATIIHHCERADPPIDFDEQVDAVFKTRALVPLPQLEEV